MLKKGPLKKESASQTLRRLEDDRMTAEEFMQGLEKGVEEDQILKLVSPKWLEEFFKAVQKGLEAPLVKRLGDVAVVLDLAILGAN